MKIELERIKVDAETMDYLQSLHYEHLSYKTILDDIIMVKRGYEHNKETYEAFMNDFKENFIKFEMTKEQLVSTYAEKYLNPKYEYEFDFINREIVIREVIKGGCSSCN